MVMLGARLLTDSKWIIFSSIPIKSVAWSFCQTNVVIRASFVTASLSGTGSFGSSYRSSNRTTFLYVSLMLLVHLLHDLVSELILLFQPMNLLDNPVVLLSDHSYGPVTEICSYGWAQQLIRSPQYIQISISSAGVLHLFRALLFVVTASAHSQT